MSASSLERIAVLIGTVVLTTLQVRSCEQARYQEQRINEANAVADTFKAKYNELSQTYEDRMTVMFETVDVLRALRKQNHDLANQLEGLGADVISLTNTVVDLREQFDGDTTATRTLAGWEFPIFQRNDYGDSFLEVSGTASIDTTGAASWSLGFGGRLGIRTAISRLPDEQIRVDLFSEVPSLQVYDISGAHALGELKRDRKFPWLPVGLSAVAGFILGRL